MMMDTIDTPLGKITLRAAREGDLEAFRELRLEALQENPSSFGSDYAVNKAQPKEFWVGRLNLEGENVAKVLGKVLHLRVGYFRAHVVVASGLDVGHDVRREARSHRGNSLAASKQWTVRRDDRRRVEATRHAARPEAAVGKMAVGVIGHGQTSRPGRRRSGGATSPRVFRIGVSGVVPAVLGEQRSLGGAGGVGHREKTRSRPGRDVCRGVLQGLPCRNPGTGVDDGRGLRGESLFREHVNEEGFHRNPLAHLLFGFRRRRAHHHDRARGGMVAHEVGQPRQGGLPEFDHHAVRHDGSRDGGRRHRRPPSHDGDRLAAEEEADVVLVAAPNDCRGCPRVGQARPVAVVRWLIRVGKIEHGHLATRVLVEQVHRIPERQHVGVPAEAY